MPGSTCASAPRPAKGALYLRAGQEKRPYSRYELTSSNNLPSIERGAGQGLLPGRSNDLFAANGFLSHDVGASLRYEYKLDELRLVTLKFGAYNGQGESLNDVNNTKSFGARGHRRHLLQARHRRLLVRPRWHRHRRRPLPDSAFTNYAWGVDAQWGKPGDEGLYVLGEYLDGNDATAAKNKIRGIQGLAAYNYRLKSPTSWLYAIEPAFRFDLADPNTSAGERPGHPDHRGAGDLHVEPGAAPGGLRARELPGRRDPEHQRHAQRADRELLDRV